MQSLSSFPLATLLQSLQQQQQPPQPLRAIDQAKMKVRYLSLFYFTAVFIHYAEHNEPRIQLVFENHVFVISFSHFIHFVTANWCQYCYEHRTSLQLINGNYNICRRAITAPIKSIAMRPLVRCVRLSVDRRIRREGDKYNRETRGERRREMMMIGEIKIFILIVK